MRVEEGSGPRYRRPGSLPSSRGDPWETVKFEALQVSSGEQVEACEKNSENSDNFDEHQQKDG